MEAFLDTSTGGSYWNKALAKWNGTNWSILAITSNIGGSGLNGRTFAQGNVYGSGALYDFANLQQGLNLGRLVHALLLSGDKLYVGGSFTNAGGVPAKNMACWDGTQLRWQ